MPSMLLLIAAVTYFPRFFRHHIERFCETSYNVPRRGFRVRGVFIGGGESQGNPKIILGNP